MKYQIPSTLRWQQNPAEGALTLLTSSSTTRLFEKCLPWLSKYSGATALQDLGRQSGRRRSAKLVPTFPNRRVSRGQRNRSPRPLISVYRNWIATYFIQVAPQLASRGLRGWVHPVPDPLPLRKSVSAVNRTRDLCICSQKPWTQDHRGGPSMIIRRLFGK